MHHYDDLFKEQYERIQRKLDQIGGDFIYSRQLPEHMFIDNPRFTALMGISHKTAQLWRDNGIMSYSQVGNKIFYQMSDIQELLQRNYIKARQEAKK